MKRLLITLLLASSMAVASSSGSHSSSRGFHAARIHVLKAKTPKKPRVKLAKPRKPRKVKV